MAIGVWVTVIDLVGVAVSDTDELRFIKNSPANKSPFKRFILQIHRMNSLYGLDLILYKNLGRSQKLAIVPVGSTDRSPGKLKRP